MDDKMCELRRLSECDALRQDCFCKWSQKTDNGHQKSKISGRIKFLYFISFKAAGTRLQPLYFQKDGNVNWPANCRFIIFFQKIRNVKILQKFERNWNVSKNWKIVGNGNWSAEVSSSFAALYFEASCRRTYKIKI